MIQSRLMNLVAALLLFAPLTVQAKEAKYDPARIDAAAQTIFVQGCLAGHDNIASWAAAQSYFDKTRKFTPAEASKKGTEIVYPVKEDLATAMWSVKDTSILLLAFPNGGCAVTHGVYMPKDSAAKFMTDIGKLVESKTGRKPLYQSRYDEKLGTHFHVLNLSPGKKGFKTYVSLRIYNDDYSDKLKTMIYFFNSPLLFTP